MSTTAREKFSHWVTKQLAAGLTRTQVAASLGLTDSAVFRILKGDRKVPRGETAFAIERATKDEGEGQILASEWYANGTAGEDAA